MVLAFLQAEVDSPRFGYLARKAVGDMKLIANPRLDEPRENASRRTALQRYRGFGSNDLLFRGFPAEVATWERMRLTRDDLGGETLGSRDRGQRLRAQLRLRGSAAGAGQPVEESLRLGTNCRWFDTDGLQ